MSTTITYTNAATLQSFCVELGFRSFEGTPGDIVLQRRLANDCPLAVSIVVDADGEVREHNAEWSNYVTSNYWHFDSHSEELASGRIGMDGRLTAAQKPTEAQRTTLIKIYGGQIKPFGVSGSPDRPVMAWVGATANEIEAILGKKVYFNQ